MNDETVWLKCYQRIDVKEKCKQNSCIPATIHWLISWNGLIGNSSLGLNLENFQIDICNNIPSEKRSFTTIANYIEDKYGKSNFNFQIENKFETGKEKFERIFELISNQIGVGISIHSGIRCSKSNRGINLWNSKQNVPYVQNYLRNFFSRVELSKIIRGWHIIPVVGMSKKKLIIKDLSNGKIKKFSREYLEFLHNHEGLTGGNDLVWLKND
ncbi:MAG: hypothetical protein GF308_16040 [Candidatus Heimdallarchaeota archaeon]|nr:hypothetical protein [Candidatus Heimdallarchaeota archaeon]